MREKSYCRQEVAARYLSGQDMRTIGSALGISAGTVSHTLPKVGVQARRAGRPFRHIECDVPDDRLIKELYLQGLSLRAISELMHISRMAVSTSLKRTNTASRRKSRRKPR